LSIDKLAIVLAKASAPVFSDLSTSGGVTCEGDVARVSSSSSSQLSLMIRSFSSRFFSRRFSFFFELLLIVLVFLDWFSELGATHPIICPFGSAVRSICCCREPRKRLISSCGVNPGLTLSSFRTLVRWYTKKKCVGTATQKTYEPSTLLDSGTIRSCVLGSTAIPETDFSGLTGGNDIANKRLGLHKEG
jgi:hypothetical protein